MTISNWTTEGLRRILAFIDQRLLRPPEFRLLWFKLGRRQDAPRR